MLGPCLFGSRPTIESFRNWDASQNKADNVWKIGTIVQQRCSRIFFKTPNPFPEWNRKRHLGIFRHSREPKWQLAYSGVRSDQSKFDPKCFIRCPTFTAQGCQLLWQISGHIWLGKCSIWLANISWLLRHRCRWFAGQWRRCKGTQFRLLQEWHGPVE